MLTNRELNCIAEKHGLNIDTNNINVIYVDLLEKTKALTIEAIKAFEDKDTVIVGLSLRRKNIKEHDIKHILIE